MLGFNIADHKYIKVFKLQYPKIFQQFILEGGFFNQSPQKILNTTGTIKRSTQPTKKNPFSISNVQSETASYRQTSSMAFQVI